MATRRIYETEVRHDGLNKFRHIRGSDQFVVMQKAEAQKRAWDEMWKKKQKAEEKKKQREAAIKDKEQKKNLAIVKTKEAQDILESLENTLLHTLKINDAIDWDSLIDTESFPENRPVRQKPMMVDERPDQSEERFQPKLNLFDRIFSSSKNKKEASAAHRFDLELRAWERKKNECDEINKKQEEKFRQETREWERRKKEYELNQKERNEAMIEKKNQYQNHDTGAIVDYCEMVLANSEYPDYFPQEWDLDYQADAKILIVDYSLPDIDSLPSTSAVKYVISRDEFTESKLTQASLNKLYDSLLYQIALRTIHELYEADVIDALGSIVFNGWVDSVDKATGQNVNACIMSIQASKQEFLEINLEKVDPKACFKLLKGVGSAKLHGISPVAPIISIDKEDRRFVSAYDVVDGLDETDNLAAMDWQDFEHLIREMFEKEFVSAGGEVKVTQASRDGGVDAIAFDPDPIRGGKIVIQAKRYTNVVGVSAVRDLYGTTVNEGATKGILVTTANYGPDAYEFAKGKPLTLLNGANLLHLLEKHGHKAKIDLKEAKLALSEQKI